MVSNFGMISIFALGRCLSLTMMSMAVHMGDFGMRDEFGCPRSIGTWCPNYVASPKTRKISVFFRTVLLLARSVRVQAAICVCIFGEFARARVWVWRFVCVRSCCVGALVTGPLALQEFASCARVAVVFAAWCSCARVCLERSFTRNVFVIWRCVSPPMLFRTFV